MHLLRLVHRCYDSHDPGCTKPAPDPAVLREPISRILAAKMAAGVVHGYGSDVPAELLISIMQRAIKHTVQDEAPTSRLFRGWTALAWYILARLLDACCAAGRCVALGRWLPATRSDVVLLRILRAQTDLPAQAHPA